MIVRQFRTWFAEKSVLVLDLRSVSDLMYTEKDVRLLQCSCFPVKMDPSGGIDIIDILEKPDVPDLCGRGLSVLTLSSRSDWSSCSAMLFIVGSVEPFNCSVGALVAMAELRDA